MLTPEEKLKRADKTLRSASMLCGLNGLALLVLSVFTYSKHVLSRNWDHHVPSEAFHALMEAMSVVMFWLLPLMSVSFFLIWYRIWDYRRKRDGKR